jgi:hypothetical protein
MISLKERPSASNGSLTGGSEALQAPQRPVSAKCRAGTLFFVPQEEHVDTMENDMKA